MEKIILTADKRDATGKGAARKLRREGLTPAVLYAKSYSVPLTLVKKDILKILRSEAAEHSLINLRVNSDGAQKDHITIVKDYQLEPVKNHLLHVDFMEVSMDKLIEVTVPIHIVKEPMGIKKGGILEFKIREVEVECMPSQIPGNIEVDASSVDIGGAFYIEDLILPEGIKVLADPKVAVLSVSAKAAEEKEEREEEAAEETEAQEKAQE
jgi:large subunit ribosomal protein L25